MVRFIGEHTSKVDDKGRVIFPAAFKSKMLAEGDDLRLVVRKENFASCLEAFTYSEWERQSDNVLSKLNPTFNEKHAIFWRAYMRNRAVVEPDLKFGRISIPKKLLDMIGVKKEVVFYGNDYKVEIWAKEVYEALEGSNEEISTLAGQLSETI